jgi:signal transduction histidine kinase
MKLLCAAVIAGLSLFCAPAVSAADTVKRVLIFSSADINTPGISMVSKAIRDSLATNSQIRFQFYNEALDVVRIPRETYEGDMVRLLQRKYDGQKIDLIICLYAYSLEFLLKHEREVFSDVPKVVVAHDFREIAPLKLSPNVAGVVGKVELAPLIRDGLTLQPTTDRVVVIAGNSVFDRIWLGEAQKELEQFKDRIQLVYLTDATIDELKIQLAALPPHSIVVLLSFTLDRTGVSYSTIEALDILAPYSNAPMCAIADASLGHGVIGGHLVSYDALGRSASEVVLRILAGESPSDVGVQTIESVPMFDSRQLSRWGISEAALPPGSRVYFKEPSFWQLYKWRIVGALTLIAVQTLFIAGLLVERRRRRLSREQLDRLNAELEQRVVDRTAALDAKSRELETFAYSVAHDLKAPLHGIDGYSRLLLEDHSEQLNEEGRQFVQTITASTSEMNQLIEDLLDYSRLERSTVRPDRVELQPLVKSIVEQKAREASGRKIDFVVNVNGGYVLADVSGLTQALKNYLDNAIKFTGKREQARIEIGVDEKPNSCVLWVRDNGVGFDMKYHDRIFGIFQRLNRAEEYPGTGIGLAIVRKAMERIGGRAWATSAPGEGSTFFLEIPR